ncbi:MAG: PAS-domain containing protein [Proteobacteria bacterium]|nr:PAS-domain containing protein [Pseudomonadota bacterium]
MVRAFAAMDGFLRAASGAREDRAHSRASLEPTHRALDRMVVALVLIFLTIAGYSFTVYFSSARMEQIERGDLSLALATALVATEIARNPRADASMDLPVLPAEVALSGRRFLLLDSANVVRGGHVGAGEYGRAAAELFSAPTPFSHTRGEGLLQRVRLADGRDASVILRQPPGFEGRLLAIQSLDETLLPWRQHVSRVGALIACFGAVTLAFTLVFLAQRRRTCHVGAAADHLQRVASLALKNGQCGLWDWHFNREHVFWSDSMHRLLGREPDGHKPCQRIVKRLHPDDRGMLDELRDALGKGQTELSRLFRMCHEDGSYRWLRLKAVSAGSYRRSGSRMIGIVMDVTDERNAEVESRRADARLREGIDSLSEAFVLWDENNCLVMCNSRYQAFHGLPDALVQRGIPYARLMEAAREPKVLIEIDRGSLREGERSYEAQFEDGRWLLISERRTDDGGFVSVGTDITARKLQEERLLDNERQLRLTITDLGNSREAFRRQAAQISELADKYLEQKAEAISANRAKAEFLANMHHEIRTPLNHIIGFAEMIEQEVFGPCGSERYVDYARDIRASGTNLMDMLCEILDMAQIEAGRVALQRVDVAVGELLEKAAATVRPDASAKAITVEIDPSATEAAGQRIINVDPNAISQALSYLMRNSIRLTDAGGHISVRARVSADYVNVFVADTAARLSACEIGTLANPFGHIDRMLQDGCKGAGLGVSIARALVELHGGTLKMRATPNAGTLVMIHLPTSFSPVQLDLPIGPN